MSINNATTPQVAWRKPRVRCLLSGTTASDATASFSGGGGVGLIEANVTNNNWYQADRFSAHFAITPGSPYDANWWSQQTDIALTIQLGFLPPNTPEGPGNVPWQTVIEGGADQIVVDPVQGTVQVDGRDLSALLIDSRTVEAFPNHTASQIATILASRHGLTPVVTSTSTPVERFYAADKTISELGNFHRWTTEWDLLVFLAQHENFDLFVQGRELHFQPKTTANSDPWTVLYRPPQSSGAPNAASPPRLDVTTLRLQRSILLAKDIEVDVLSWSTQRATTIKSIAKKTGGGGNKSPVQKYVYVYPNLTRAQAQTKANAILQNLTQHERIIEFDQPGVLTIDARSAIRLVGTGTSWDQRYFIDSIQRHISFDGGFTQSVRAKNHDAASQIAVL